MPNRRNTRKSRMLSSAVGMATNLINTAERMAENAANAVVNVPFGLVIGAKNVLKKGVRRTTNGVTSIASRGASGVENAFGKLVSRKNRRNSRKNRKDSRKNRKDSRKNRKDSRKNSRKNRKDSRKNRKDSRKNSRKNRKDSRKNRKDSRKNRK